MDLNVKCIFMVGFDTVSSPCGCSVGMLLPDQFLSIIMGPFLSFSTVFHIWDPKHGYAVPVERKFPLCQFWNEHCLSV